jgi:hypothetical protein
MSYPLFFGDDSFFLSIGEPFELYFSTEKSLQIAAPTAANVGKALAQKVHLPSVNRQRFAAPKTKKED